MKRSNSGFGHAHRGGSQTGLTSPEPISRTFISISLFYSPIALILKRNFEACLGLLKWKEQNAKAVTHNC